LLIDTDGMIRFYHTCKIDKIILCKRKYSSFTKCISLSIHTEAVQIDLLRNIFQLNCCISIYLQVLKLLLMNG